MGIIEVACIMFVIFFLAFAGVIIWIRIFLWIIDKFQGTNVGSLLLLIWVCLFGTVIGTLVYVVQ